MERQQGKIRFGTKINGEVHWPQDNPHNSNYNSTQSRSAYDPSNYY